jgi:hypothetical protein
MVMMETGRNERYQSDVAAFFEGALDSVSGAKPRLYTMQYAFGAFARALNGVMGPPAGRIVRGESSDKVSLALVRAFNVPTNRART